MPVFAQFNPIRYTYRTDTQEFIANVKYTHPWLGKGWLSASGKETQRNGS